MTKPNPGFKLHTDEKGYIWYAQPGQMAVSSTLKLSDFASKLPLSAEDTAQVMGSTPNVELILKLYDCKLDGKLKSLQVCTPAVCPTRSRRSKPEVAIMDTSNWAGWPASLGGWHEFGEEDRPSYFLSGAYANGASFEDVRNVLPDHPAWKAMGFIPHLNAERCSQLFAVLLDPRWFIDVDEPEKQVKMECFLGLTPKHQAIVSNKTKKLSEYDLSPEDAYRVVLCKMVMECWYSNRPSTVEQYKQPRNFLWRIHASEGAAAKADLRTSQVFLSFLRGVWLQSMYRARKGVSADELFVPEYFFANEDEVTAFKTYMEEPV